MRQVLAVLLLVESVLTASWILRLLPTLVVYDWLALTLIAARAAVAILQFTSASMLFKRQPMGRLFGRRVLLASAVLTTMELGFRLSPNNVFVTFQWPIVGIYWLYALAAFAWLRARG